MQLKPIQIETEEGRKRGPQKPPEKESLSDSFANAVLDAPFIRKSVRHMADTLVHDDNNEALADRAYGWRQSVLYGGTEGLAAAGKITMKYLFR